MKFLTSNRIRDLLIFGFILATFFPFYTDDYTTDGLYLGFTIAEWLIFELLLFVSCIAAYKHGQNFNSEETQWR